MVSSVELLTLFNFHSWKRDMEIQLCSRGIYRVTMETEEDPTSVTNKARLLNKKDEAFIFLCLSITWHFLFHLLRLNTLKEIWDKLETLYGKLRWFESIPAWEWVDVSPSFQFRDLEWFFHKVQAHCLIVEAMLSGERGWSTHPRHTLQTWSWLFNFCLYIPYGEAHNP